MFNTLEEQRVAYVVEYNKKKSVEIADLDSSRRCAGQGKFI
jgi:hypothetical protein